MFATVVIDIPDMNHKGFDYKVPTHLMKTVKIGCRVLVPLGNRVTQGFVINLKETTDIKTKEMKENLDITPSLTEEMIQLAFWMSEHYSSHLFRALQLLIPSALKTKVEEYVVCSQEDNLILEEREKEIFDWINKEQPFKLSKLMESLSNDYSLVEEMFKSGVIYVVKDFQDKTKRKKVSTVKLQKSLDKLLLEIADIPKNARKQRDILEYFLFHEIEQVELSILLSEVEANRSSIQALEKKKLLEVFEREVDRDPYNNRTFIDKKVKLNKEQEIVLEKVIQAFRGQENRPILLHGVTGSGKTEIYLNAIEFALGQQKSSIVLVPEISLTPQMVERFKGRFGDLVAVLHSRLSQGERLDEWRRIQRGQARIAVGARSAIFAPFKDLGLVIIDEEHESSYKQEEHPKYHVREIAKWRGNYHQAIILMGSATPSMESYYQAKNGGYQLLELPHRIEGSTLPTIHLVDMREELRTGNRSMFSEMLQKQITEKLDKKEQIVLFLNRRGYSTFVMCRSCGYVMKCPHCDISLTYHHTNKVVRCHYCGYTEKEPKTCPECGSKHIRYFGTGTQKVEEELAKRFPGVRVIRMDVDTTSKKGAHEKLLNSFKKQEADILLGTQMIAKGLDFPKVTLVGVIAADTVLKIPDFRSAERTFQLLTQVSGRAGRHELKGDVVIQTYSPEHYSIDYASKQDYFPFYKKELEQRKLMEYPPFKRLILIHFSHMDVNQVMKASEKFVRELKNKQIEGVEILGPVAAPISRVKDRYRFQCMIKYNNELIITTYIQDVIRQTIDYFKDRQLLISVDVDPYVLM